MQKTISIVVAIFNRKDELFELLNSLIAQTDKDFDFWYQKLGLISMATYFILSLKYYNLYRKVIYDTTSYADSILFKFFFNF